MRRISRYTFLALFLTALLPASAFAASGFMPDGSDKSVSIFLNQLFGALVGAAGGPGGGADPLASSLGKLNELLLFVGGVLLAYTLVAGTMQTAHDGEVLGKRWSSMWVPIRTSLGIAAIVPIINGYAVIQVIVMWLVLQGVGGANLIWNAYASTTNSSNQALNSVDVKGIDGFSQDLLKTLVCAKTTEAQLNLQRGDGTSVGNLNYQGYTVATQTPTSTGGARWTSDGFGETGCGGYEPPPAPRLTSASGYASDVDNINQAHIRATQTLVSRLDPMARAIAYSKEENGGGQTFAQIASSYKMQTYIDEYKKTVLTASANSAQNQARIEAAKANIVKDGWISAGAWYVEWARLNAQIRAQVGNIPKYVPMVGTAFNSTGFQDAMTLNLNSKLNAVLKAQNYASTWGVEAQNKEALERAATATSGDGVAAMIWEKVTRVAFPQSANAADSNILRAFVMGSGNNSVSKDPILVAEGLGSEVMAGAGGLMILSAAAGGLWAKAVADISLLALSLGMPLMVFGLMLAYYIPFLPFVIWFGGVIGWLVMVVEALVAAPMWAVSHLYPDGDGVVGRGGQGYSLVLSLTLRPALMIVGLAAAMSIMLPVGYFFHTLFMPAFELAQGGAIGFFGIFAGIAIYTTLLVNIVSKVVSLMHVIPDQLLRWMGGPSSDLGSHGHAANQGLQAAAGGFLGATAGKSIEGVRGLQQTRATRRAAEAQEAGNEMQHRRALSERMDQQQGQIQSFDQLGLREGDGVVAANMAGRAAREDAIGGAQKALKADDSMAGQKYRMASKQGDVDAMDKAIWSKVKEQNGGSNPNEIAESARNATYEKWAAPQANNPNIAPTYGEAMQKFQAAKARVESGGSPNPGPEAQPAETQAPPPRE